MTTPEEDRHRAARQEESRRQAAVNVNRILADQQEGERRYMEQQALNNKRNVV